VMRTFIARLFIRCHGGDQIMEDQRDELCSTVGRKEKLSYKFYSGKGLRDLHIKGRRISQR